MRPIQVVHAGVVPYAAADEWQRSLHARRLAGEIPDVLLLLEHPHTYTLGRRFSEEHLLASPAHLASRGIEVHHCDRGGSVTYHGPGQLVGYPIIDLRRPPEAREGERWPDAIVYLRTLEEAIIRGVRPFGLIAGRREGMTGVWVGEAKLASIGINVSRGVSRHGFALNVDPDLSFFEGIVACGIPEVQMTSLARLLPKAPPLEDVAGSVAGHLAKLVHRRPVPASPADLDPPQRVRNPAGEVVELFPAGTATSKEVLDVQG